MAADGRGEDVTFANSFEQVFLTLPDQGDHGAETGAAVWAAIEAVQQLFDVFFGGAAVAGIACALHAGLAVQGRHFQAGIFAKTVFSGKPMDGG